MKKLSCGLFMLFALSACDAPTANAVDVDVEDAGDDAAWLVADAGDRLAIPAETSDKDAIIATIRFDGNAELRFVDESFSGAEGGVGLLSIGVRVVGIRELGLSPLELYLALAPDGEVPERLKEHHSLVVEQQGRTSAVPRRVPVEHASQTQAKAWSIGEPLKVLTQDTGFLAEDCAYFLDPDGSVYWYDNFCADVASQGGYVSCNAGASTIATVGYAYTGSSGRRWLGACAPTTSMNWIVQRESIANVWNDVSGTSVLLLGAEWVEYTSTTTQSGNYRSKVNPLSSGQLIQFGAARG